jgi:hypothetical protein
LFYRKFSESEPKLEQVKFQMALLRATSTGRAVEKPLHKFRSRPRVRREDITAVVLKDLLEQKDLAPWRCRLPPRPIIDWTPLYAIAALPTGIDVFPL